MQHLYTEYKLQFKERNMAEVSKNEPFSLDIDIDPDFEPQKRPRSCTWPLPRPESNAGKPESNDDIIPEEEDEDDDVTAPSSSSSTTVNKVNGGIAIPQIPSKHQNLTTTKDEELTLTSNEGNDVVGSPLSTHTHTVSALNGLVSQPRKSSARRNAWGNYSYADLITQAIESSPDQRLTLSQIYEWMVRSVPYFKDKGDSNSSAGWKNSIRHNLSLHSRFMRVQNEGTGKSSWWMVNPEGGKGGKAPRRRAVSMDNSNKLIKGARGRAAKKKAALGLQTVQDGSSESLSLSSSLSKWTGSPTSRSSDELDAWTDFRSRTNSNASTVSGRLSPILANELDEALDDQSISPLSPMLYSSPSSLSPSTAPLGLADLALTINLNDGLPDDLMGDLLDDISLTASQQPSGQDADSGGASQTGNSVFTFSCSGSNSSLGVPSSGSYGPLSAIFQLSPPSSSVTSLRQSPMQTIQENHPASFSCLSSRFNHHHHTLQDLLSPETHSGHVSDVMLTHSDPLMSQASASVSLSQNSRRNATLLHKDPIVSTSREGAAGPDSQTSSAPGWQAQASLSTPNREVLCSSKDLDQQAKQLLQHLPSPGGNSSMQLGGSAAHNSTSAQHLGTLQLAAQDRFPVPPIPAELDLDMFNGSLDCDMETIISNELMDADCLDFSFDSSSLLSAAQNANKMSTAGVFSSSKPTSSSRSWVPS